MEIDPIKLVIHGAPNRSLQELSIGEVVQSFPVHLHRLDTSTVKNSCISTTKETGSRKKPKWVSRPPNQTSKSNEQVWMEQAPSGMVRCVLSDHTATIFGQMAKSYESTIESVHAKKSQEGLSVKINGHTQLQEGRMIMQIEGITLVGASESHQHHVERKVRSSLAPLLNSLSSFTHICGIWMFRIVADELFVMLQPKGLEEDAPLLPPFVRKGSSTDNDVMPVAIEALQRHTTLQPDEFIFVRSVTSAPMIIQLPTEPEKCPIKRPGKKNVLVTATVQPVAMCHMVCGLVSQKELAGDARAETDLDRDHWHHVSRAILELPSDWSESLTQVITCLANQVDYLASQAGLTRPEGEDDQDEPDELDRMFESQELQGSDREAGHTLSTSVPLSTSDLLSSSVPSHVIAPLSTLQRALVTCQTKLSSLRQQQSNLDDEDHEDNEMEEESEQQEDQDAAMEVDVPVTTRVPSRRTGQELPIDDATAKNEKTHDKSAVDVAALTGRVLSMMRAIDRSIQKKIPVTVLTGFLGSGKTTLLNHILSSPSHGMRIGVIVNDFSHINVDASLLKSNAGAEKLIELSNGCICCTLRGDLFTSVTELATCGSVDYICVESTGIGEPAPIVSTFTFDVSSAESSTMETFGLSALTDIVELDAVVTVVDTPAIFELIQNSHTRFTQANDAKQTSERSSRQISSNRSRSASRTKKAETPGDSSNITPSAALSQMHGEESKAKSLHSMLIEQLEFCNVLVLNKSDLATPSQAKIVAEFVKLINVKAEIIHTTHGRIEPKQIMGSKRFSEQESLSSPLLAFAAAEWHASLSSSSQPAASESAEYGITSFVYQRRVGFHGARFEQLLHEFESNNIQEFAGLLRVKGVFWIDANDTAVGIWQSTKAGTKAHISHLGGWLVDMCAWDCVTSGKELMSLSRRWHPVVGDRYIQIVFIGVGIDQSIMEARLDQCLLTRQELREVIDEENEAEESENEHAKMEVQEAVTFKLLKPVIDFDPNPNAPQVCAMAQ